VGTAAALSQAIGLLESSKDGSSNSNSNNSSLQVAQVLEAIDMLSAEGPQREELRLRCYLAAGRLGEAARAALELARLEQVCMVSSSVNVCGNQTISPCLCTNILLVKVSN
jgi:hypothetical protein